MTLEWCHHKDWQGGWLFECPKWYYGVGQFLDWDRDQTEDEQCSWQLTSEWRSPGHTRWAVSHRGHLLTYLLTNSVGTEGSHLTTLRFRFRHFQVSNLGWARFRSVRSYLVSLFPHSWLSHNDLLNEWGPCPQLRSGVDFWRVIGFPAFYSFFYSY